MLKTKKSTTEISLVCAVRFSLKPLFLLSAIVLILACLLASCSPASEQYPSTALPSQGPAISESSSSPMSESTPLAEQPAAQTEVMAGVATSCVTPGDPGSLLDVTFDAYPKAIQQFLNEGGWVNELDQALYSAGIANLPVAVEAAEMTGDGSEEVVVSIFDPGSDNTPPAGLLLIYACDQGEYQLAYQVDSRSSVPSGGAHGIFILQDLNADSLSELVTSSATCGAHTCYERVQIINWDGSQFVNRLEGETDDLPHPNIYIEPSEVAGIYDIYVTGSGIGSVGAGPQRNSTRVWSFDEQTQLWRVSSFRLEESNYRIHVLHDAGIAVKDGDYQQALMLYSRVISDTTLEDWVDPPLEQALIQAFARYQLVAIYTLQDRAAFASTMLGEMENAYPPESPQHGFFEMAAAYVKGYQEGGAEAACAAAVEYAAAHPGVLEPLGPQTFGYGNPTYYPADVCP
jgi:hypothetical protein